MRWHLADGRRGLPPARHAHAYAVAHDEGDAKHTSSGTHGEEHAPHHVCYALHAMHYARSILQTEGWCFRPQGLTQAVAWRTPRVASCGARGMLRIRPKTTGGLWSTPHRLLGGTARLNPAGCASLSLAAAVAGRPVGVSSGGGLLCWGSLFCWGWPMRAKTPGIR